jgi:UPF0716 protein FxsA
VPLLLLLAFVVVPLIELAVIVQVAQLTSLPVTLVLLLGVSVLGAVLVKREGGRAWRSFREALAAGRPPAREVADGMMVLVGGALLLTPGFVTDAVGLLLVFPPTRVLLRGWLTALITRSLVVRTIGVDPRRMRSPGPRRAAPRRGGPPPATGPGSPRSGAASGGVVEGEVVEGGVVEGGVVEGGVVEGGVVDEGGVDPDPPAGPSGPAAPPR